MRSPFDEAVRAHGAVVLRLTRAVVGPDDADDAWSETFLSALRAWPDLPEDADVRAWLATIAHRRCIDVLRARRRRATPMAEPDSDAGADAMAAAHDEEGFWLGALPDEPLWRELAALPEKQRLTVAYHHLAGLPHAEVARILGGSPAAARRACADGIARLRAALGAGSDAPSTEDERTTSDEPTTRTGAS